MSQKIGWLSDDSSSLRSDVRENEEFVAVQFSLAIPSPLFYESGTVSQREEIMGLRDEIVGHDIYVTVNMLCATGLPFNWVFILTL